MRQRVRGVRERKTSLTHSLLTHSLLTRLHSEGGREREREKNPLLFQPINFSCPTRSGTGSPWHRGSSRVICEYRNSEMDKGERERGRDNKGSGRRGRDGRGARGSILPTRELCLLSSLSYLASLSLSLLLSAADGGRRRQKTRGKSVAGWHAPGISQ